MGYQYLVRQCDRGKKTRHNCNRQERAKGNNHCHSCTSGCKTTVKRKAKNGKKYQDLKREIGRLWKLKLVEVGPVVIGAVGSATKDLIGGLKS